MRLCAIVLHKVLHDVGQARNLSGAFMVGEARKMSSSVNEKHSSSSIQPSEQPLDVVLSCLGKLDADLHEIGRKNLIAFKAWAVWTNDLDHPGPSWTPKETHLRCFGRSPSSIPTLALVQPAAEMLSLCHQSKAWPSLTP